ncbi:SulP family inorganic anion transporter [Gemmata sp. JC673]|uniref:SulP family inorganic anion transporter n=1 Tax=Gemmata algarum TaxID=2975278 RepID=A0ABU5EVF8_9BACT|nr:SulP family inorganic anion transporter [Gemmata algarum]MDY3559145.1 SulP family inorganic anion transporter [Gemmata algarum]
MAAPTNAPPPLAPGLVPNLKFDAVAGFLVFLIAMPLCLAIARASGFPPIAGIWTAVVGGVLCTLISNAQLTIKGPAAGLIVIVYGAVTELGAEFGADLSDADRAFLGYKLALGVGVTAGVIQILFGLVRAGRLADFFPLTPVHGMLASIGLIIIAKQAYEVIGVAPEKGAGPLELYAGLPAALGRINPEIAAIGLVGLLILFGLPLVKAGWVRKVPAQLIVLVAAVALGLAFDLEHKHTYLFPDSFFDVNHRAEFEVGPRFLVDMPEVLQNPAAAFAVPDFRGVLTATGIQYVVLFCLIGSLESLLSAKAIELVDPWRRKTNFDRDLLAVGAANTLCAAIGALPMISEIVRSKANIDSGGRTKAANLFHGLFLLGFVLLFPNLIHRIPLAALGAMLVYTGFRLANPVEFVRTYKVGSEQFIVFVGTILTTLATDLLIGIGVGIGLKVAFHMRHGCSVRGLFACDVEAVPEGDRLVVLVVRRAAVFSNWLGVRAVIFREAERRDEVVLDLSRTRLVDHTVMEKLHQLEDDFAHLGKRLKVIGLEEHVPLSGHPLAARKSAGHESTAAAV